MATKSDAPVIDKDKDTLMEVRGIIDGIVESGSKDYKTALNDIAATVNEYLFPKDAVVRSQCKGGILTYTKA